jgi:crotonobetainyl-CoA:carnitine CoA-transferase CaiB-like acyl-CoA transferase
MPPTRPRPLEGVRVLDLSRLLPGPFASLVLADLGAQVDKLEDPQAGDYLRRMAPQVDGSSADVPPQSSLFLLLNRDKRSLVLDLKTPAGQAAFRRLLPRYDVVLEQFRPGVLDRLGLGPDAMRRIHPPLVVCSLTGYGQTGPLASRAGHDLDYVARAGALHPQGPPEGPPTTPGIQCADVGGALWCVIGVLSALAARARSEGGEGSHVDVSMLEAALGFAAVSFGALAGGVESPPGGDVLSGGMAGYATYATKDERSIALGALEPKFFGSFLRAVGVAVEPEMLLPGPHQRALRERLASIFRERTQREWVEFAAGGDYCLEPVLTPAEAVADPHLVSRGAFFHLPSPWGALLQMRFPLTPRDAEHRAPPQAGEHTTAILREAGFTDAEIEACR